MVPMTKRMRLRLVACAVAGLLLIAGALATAGAAGAADQGDGHGISHSGNNP